MTGGGGGGAASPPGLDRDSMATDNGGGGGFPFGQATREGAPPVPLPVVFVGTVVVAKNAWYDCARTEADKPKNDLTRPTMRPRFAGNNFTAVVTAAQSNHAPPCHASIKEMERTSVGSMPAKAPVVQSQARKYPMAAMTQPIIAVGTDPFRS